MGIIVVRNNSGWRSFTTLAHSFLLLKLVCHWRSCKKDACFYLRVMVLLLVGLLQKMASLAMDLNLSLHPRQRLCSRLMYALLLDSEKGRVPDLFTDFASAAPSKAAMSKLRCVS